MLGGLVVLLLLHVRRRKCEEAKKYTPGDRIRRNCTILLSYQYSQLYNIGVLYFELAIRELRYLGYFFGTTIPATFRKSGFRCPRAERHP